MGRNIIWGITALMFFSQSYSEISRLRLSWRSDPATSMVIGWSQLNGNGARVYYGKEDLGNSKPEDYPFNHGIDSENDRQNLNNRFSRLKNLEPNTMYYFVIKDNNSTSQRYKFRTAPSNATDAKISFLHGGDSRSSRSGRVSVNRHAAKIRPLFVAFGGDYIDKSNEASWKAWLDDWQSIIDDDGYMPAIVPARGNHETDNDVSQIFDTPTNDVVYAFSFGGTLFRLWVLNSEKGNDAEQGDWLDNDLQDHSTTLWKMAHWHSPISPIGDKPFKNGMYNNWANVLYNNRMNLAGESHSHVAKRTYPIRPDKNHEGDYIRDDENGTVYMGEGCWGVPVRSPKNNYDWVMGRGAFHEFNWITITPEKMQLRTIQTSGDAAGSPYVDLNDPFKLPDGFKLWNPGGNGTVTDLKRHVDLVEGCTDKDALNYNADAHVDDGGCKFFTPVNGLAGVGYGKLGINRVISANQNVYLNIGVEKGNGVADLKIWDKQGKLIWKEQFSSTHSTYHVKLPTSLKLGKGVYYSQLKQAGKTVSTPITIFK